MNILVVDDSRAMRLIVSRSLESAGFMGHTLTEAATGLQALEAVRVAQPDLILCDWNMPQMSGIRLLNTLREEGLNIKFGFVTTEATPRRCREASEAGALFLITKPFSVEHFRERLMPILG